MPLSRVGMFGTTGDAQVNKNTGNVRQLYSLDVVDTSKQVAGMITGTGAGAFIRGPQVYSPAGFMLGGHPSNSGTVGFSSVSGTQGWQLSAESAQYVPIEQLNDLYFTAVVAGDNIMWLMI